MFGHIFIWNQGMGSMQNFIIFNRRILYDL